MIEVKQSKYADPVMLWKHLRKADVDEIKAASGMHPLDALVMGYEESDECYTIWANEERLGMFGVSQDAGNQSVGRVWLLGTDGIMAHKYDFLRKSVQWRDELHKRFPVLYNNIDARNEVHIKWLQWLDFSFINSMENYGYEGRPFYQFVRLHNV